MTEPTTDQHDARSVVDLEPPPFVDRRRNLQPEPARPEQTDPILEVFADGETQA